MRIRRWARGREGRARCHRSCKVGIGLAGHEAGGLGFADALDGGEGEPHAPALLGLLDAVCRAGVVDVDGQDGHAVAAGIGHQHPSRPHPGVVLQEPGVQKRREPRFQDRGLQSGNRESNSVRPAESVRAEGRDDLPHLVQHPLAVAAFCGREAKPGLRVLRLAECRDVPQHQRPVPALRAQGSPRARYARQTQGRPRSGDRRADARLVHRLRSGMACCSGRADFHTALAKEPFDALKVPGLTASGEYTAGQRLGEATGHRTDRRLPVAEACALERIGWRRSRRCCVLRARSGPGRGQIKPGKLACRCSDLVCGA